MGKRLVRRRLGRVADFCPICRGLSCLRAARLSQTIHLYYIPLSPGSVVTHEYQCEECGSLMNGSGDPYAAFSRSRTRDVVELALETNPDLVDRRRQRLEIEDRVDSGALSPDERRALIAEPFLALNYMAQSKAAGTIPTSSGMAIVVLVFLAPITAAVLLSHNADIRAKVILPFLCLSLLAIIAIDVRRGAFDGARRGLHPLLVRSLLPLRPQRHEIQDTLLALRRNKLPIGKRIKTDSLMRDLVAAEAERPMA